MKISARNVLAGEILSIVQGPVTAEVTLRIAEGTHLVATITTASAHALNLREGMQAFGIIKSSSVMIGVDDAQPLDD